MAFSQCGKIRLGEAATTVVTVLLGYLVVVDKVVNCSNKLNMTPVPHSSPWLLKSPTPSLRPTRSEWFLHLPLSCRQPLRCSTPPRHVPCSQSSCGHMSLSGTTSFDAASTIPPSLGIRLRAFSSTSGDGNPTTLCRLE